MMTEVRGASNKKAKRELGWSPRYTSWRQGFAKGLGKPAHPAEPGASALG
jgi:2-alkyl-3-oxoalkanoate reductase